MKHWKTYSLARSHNPIAPWTLVCAGDKRLIQPDPQVVFAYDVSNLKNGRLAK